MKKEKIYSILYLLSLVLFLIDLLVQDQIVFTYQDSYGLIFKMSWVYWLGVISLIFLLYFHYSNFKKLDEKYVYLSFTVLVVYLIGTPFFYEHLPRFEDSWSHSFLAQEMFKNKRVVNKISTYEQYPGAFLYIGILLQVLPSYYVMKFFTPLFYILGMVVIYISFKYLFNSRISFLTSVLHMFFNWTVEDNHISPQFLMLYVYFVFIYVLIRMLSDKKKNMKLFITISLFSLAIVFSHPGTPLFLLFILGSVIVLCKKFRGVLFPITTFLLITFIIYHLYQSAMLESYMTMTKQFFEVLMSGTGFARASVRFHTSFLSRQIFLSSRIGITIISLILGMLGLFIAYKRGYALGTKFFFAWTFSLTLFIIFEGFALGGEFHERFVLISCLPLAAMSAYILIEKRVGAFMLIILLIITPIYYIAKYGNEAFESESVEKLKADCFYENFYSDCEMRQEIVDSQLFYEIQKKFGKRDFTMNREEIMAASINLDKPVADVIELIDSYASEMKLDRIYSTNNAMTFR